MRQAASRRLAGLVSPVLALAYLGFVSLGMPDGLLGVGWPSMRDDFGVPVDAVGFVLAVMTAGYFSSSVAAGFVLARLGVGRLLAVSTVLAGCALTGYALSPGLPLLVAFALVLGLGSGAVDSGLNTYAAGHFGARQMNWLHASFGLGAMVGPLVMSAALETDLTWRWGYGAVALAQAALAVAFLLTVRLWDDQPPATPGPVHDDRPPRVGAVSAGSTLRLPAVWLGVVLFVVYTGIEVGVGLWAYTLLTESRGVSPGVAGVCVSAYWGALFVGRVLYGVAADRLRTGQVLGVCLCTMGLGAGLLAVPAPEALAVLGVVLIGGFAAPVFPLLTLTTAERVGPAHADRAIGMQVAGAGLGGAAIPAGIGVLIGRYGGGALGVSLVALAALAIMLYLTLGRRAVPPDAPLAAGTPHRRSGAYRDGVE
ncbi:MAG: MFS transporter [Actinomycetes bacterium]